MASDHPKGSLGASTSAGGRLPRFGTGGHTRSGENDRNVRSPRAPPTTSTQTSPVATFVTCATNSHLAERRPVPVMSTGSPFFTPAQLDLRCKRADPSTAGATFFRRVINSVPSARCRLPRPRGGSKKTAPAHHELSRALQK